MFLVKCVSDDRKKAVFVKADGLTALITETKLKLKLADGDYEVYQEADGTLIDDDSIFEALCEEAKANKQKLCIMLLPLGTEWKRVGESGTNQDSSSRLERSSSESSSSGSGNSSESDSSSNSHSSGTPRGFPISNVVPFLDPILEIMDNSSGGHCPRHFPNLRKHAIKEVFHAIGNYMIFTLKDYSKGTARGLAKLVMNYADSKYAKIFAINIGDQVSDSGHSYFSQQIYAFVQANKGEENRTPKGSRKRRTNADEEAAADDEGLLPPAKQDSYGCVAFELPLPAHETSETQEEQRVKSLTINPEVLDAQRLMRDTYPTQRIEINRGKPMLRNLPQIIDRWPLLRRSMFLINHGDILLGKNVKAVWTKNVSQKWANIFDFMKHYCQTNYKDSSSMRDLIGDADSFDMGSRSTQAKCASIFQLIVGFMGEQQSALLTNVPADATVEEMVAASSGNQGFPLLVVKGDSLFQYDSLFVMLVGKVSIEVEDPMEAVLVLLLSYYIFNITYHPKLHSSLEFFQRFFLEVNPPKEQGCKRAKQRRTIDPIDSKVKSLAAKLVQYTCQWTVLS